MRGTRAARARRRVAYVHARKQTRTEFDSRAPFRSVAMITFRRERYAILLNLAGPSNVRARQRCASRPMTLCPPRPHSNAIETYPPGALPVDRFGGTFARTAAGLRFVRHCRAIRILVYERNRPLSLPFVSQDGARIFVRSGADRATP